MPLPSIFYQLNGFQLNAIQIYIKMWENLHRSSNLLMLTFEWGTPNHPQSSPLKMFHFKMYWSNKINITSQNQKKTWELSLYSQISKKTCYFSYFSIIHQNKPTNWNLQGSRLSWHMDYMTRPMDERLGVAIASPQWGLVGEFCSQGMMLYQKNWYCWWLKSCTSL